MHFNNVILKIKRPQKTKPDKNILNGVKVLLILILFIYSFFFLFLFCTQVLHYPELIFLDAGTL